MAEKDDRRAKHMSDYQDREGRTGFGITYRSDQKRKVEKKKKNKTGRQGLLEELLQ